MKRYRKYGLLVCTKSHTVLLENTGVIMAHPAGISKQRTIHCALSRKENWFFVSSVHILYSLPLSLQHSCGQGGAFWNLPGHSPDKNPI